MTDLEGIEKFRFVSHAVLQMFIGWDNIKYFYWHILLDCGHIIVCAAPGTKSICPTIHMCVSCTMIELDNEKMEF